jgi:class 3 adenylate cyclase
MIETGEQSGTYNEYVRAQVLERLRFANLWSIFFFFPLVFAASAPFNENKIPLLAGFLIAESVSIFTHLVLLRAQWFRNIYIEFFFLLAASIPIIVKFVVFQLQFGEIEGGPATSSLIICVLFLVGFGVFPLQKRHCLIFCVIFVVSYGIPFPSHDLISLYTHSAYAMLLLMFSLLVVTGGYLLDEVRVSEFEAKIKLAEEKAKSELLISNMLPPKIAARLKEDSRIADNIGEATVLFADLVGFTHLSSAMLPSKVVAIIDDIFTRFDEVMGVRQLEKIKTVGDAYMAVAGVPDEIQDHATIAAFAALDMQEQLRMFNKKTGENLGIRIGLHSGSLVAGVIGTKKLTYDVWGDTVNVASRMESHGEVGKIQISETTYHNLKADFVTEFRGEIDVKGKGLMKTYYLLSKR